MNKKLRCLIQERLQLVAKLQLLVGALRSRQLSPQEYPKRYNRRKFWDFESEAEDNVFAEQLVIVAKSWMEMQQGVGHNPPGTTNITWWLSRGYAAVKSDPHFGMSAVLELHCSTTVPFSLEVTARACWRMFLTEHGKSVGVGSVADVSTDTIANSFSLRWETERFVISGKFTCQTKVSEDTVEIEWIERADVLEWGRVRFVGMQLEKRVIMKLYRVLDAHMDQKSAFTVVETHCETTPIFHERVTDQWERALVFINCAKKIITS
ncbi:unnamed protein product [Phytophthora fragariaefolia]|uniref:Unnamed protein product n=1 Tax=Phytophthora fragariaefolia TaxID=1490495 RepID=A0A9W6XQB7_9STRA|nr:unnamed protein product [Phytophthora fragariaefolia]